MHYLSHRKGREGDITSHLLELLLLKRQKIRNIRENVEKREPSLLVGVYIGAATMEEYSDDPNN